MPRIAVTGAAAQVEANAKLQSAWHSRSLVSFPFCRSASYYYYCYSSLFVICCRRARHTNGGIAEQAILELPSPALCAGV